MKPKTIISVDKVTKSFNLPHLKTGTVKSMFINPFRKKKDEIQKALNNINFKVNSGEFVGIVGKNGSGKSTLLKCIAGVYSPDSGSVQLNGTIVPFIELGVGFNGELSGRDNVYLNGSLLGFSREEIAEMYDEIVQFSELERFMDQKLKNYSSGMQVRLAFSIAIRARGDILLLDEVLAVGDSSFQRKCYRYFEDIKNSNSTIVLVTHNMSAVERYCNRAILLDEGKLILDSKPQEVADAYREMNMDTGPDKGRPVVNDRNETVKVEVISQKGSELIFSMKHSEKKGDYYFGFSLIKEHMTFAEMNSMELPNARLHKKEIKYKLNTSNLNPGIYEISATLFNAADKEPLAFTKQRPQFIIKGLDNNRGGALSLSDSWIESS